MARRSVPWLLLVLLLLLVLPAAAVAERPLWEAGAGLGGVSVPHYPGSDQSEQFVAPVPYLVYRGEALRYDREGFRGRLFSRGPWELDFSADATIAINDDDNSRAGMDDLAPVLELGPSLNATVWESSTRPRTLTLRLPVRAAVSMESDPRLDHQGWRFAPNLYYEDDAAGFSGQWRRTASLAVVFSDRDYHGYYYDVAGGDVLPSERPDYRASGGYSGIRLSVATARRMGPVWVGLFARLERLDGAAFADSPLVDRRTSVLGGAGLAWVFAESSRTVSRSRH